MIRNAKVGERVHVLRCMGNESRMNGQLVSRWPWGADTGTITRRELFWKQSPSLWVTPDHPDGVGETRFRPSDLERLPSEAPVLPSYPLAEWRAFCQFLDDQPRNQVKGDLIPARFRHLMAPETRDQRVQLNVIYCNAWGWHVYKGWQQKLAALPRGELA